MHDDIRIIGRRGGIESRRVPHSTRQGSPDPFGLEAERAIHKEIDRQGMWERYRNGKGEFEPAFFCGSDDYLLLQEMASDPHLRFFYGEFTKGVGWRSFWDVHGNQWVKVVPHPQADHANVLEKLERWGDNRVNLTEGEQAEIKRRSGGNRLKEEELAMDHRSESRFGWHDLGFHTVPFDLPNFPENVEQWLNHGTFDEDGEWVDGCWPRYNRMREQLISIMYDMVKAHKAEGDNRTKAVKAQRKIEQTALLRGRWNDLWKWWMSKQGEAKADAEARAEARGDLEVDGVTVQFITNTQMPLTIRQMNSLKRMIEAFRLEMGFEEPVMRFWASTMCTKCDTEARMLLPMTAEVAFCKICGTTNAQVVSMEYCPLLESGPGAPDYWELAEDLRRQIASKFAEGADLEEIKPLERRLHFIEVEHIKLVDHNNLFYGDHSVDERFC